MKVNFRLIGKVGFLLVIVGYFMPVSFIDNGFEIAEDFMLGVGGELFFGLLMYLLIISAFFGFIIGVLLLLKKCIKPIIDWAVIISCIVSGLIACLRLIVFWKGLDYGLDLQPGGYLILIGWIVILVFQIISKTRNET
jgi:hypothetical protein